MIPHGWRPSGVLAAGAVPRLLLAAGLAGLLRAGFLWATGRIGGWMAAIGLTDLTLGYDCHPAVHHLDAEFPAGSLTAVVGPNGAGKSTLLRAIPNRARA